MNFENEIQAREYLQSTDFYFTVDKVLQLTPERKAELEANRESARQYIRALLGETVKEQ
jgi:hypothetical protein